VSKYKRVALAVFLFVPAMLLLALPGYKPVELPYLLLMIGRFHPVILHFPIVLIIVALLLEILRRFGVAGKIDRVITVILVTAAISTVVAIASGFLLYASGDYSGRLLQQHLWIGVITGACILTTVSLYFLYHQSAKLYPIYIIGLLVSNGAVAYTSHLGGSLTHGEDYLTEYVPFIVANGDAQVAKPDSAMLIYEDMLLPVFEAKCISCHNDSRAKGEFSMTSYQKMLKGGESGAAGIVPGEPDSSDIYRRLMLPEDDDDRMPPKGKTPLTVHEISLLKKWIASGAKLNSHMLAMKQQPGAATAINNVLPELKKYRRKQQVAKIKMTELKHSLDTLAASLNVTIEPDTSADEDNMYVLSMKFPPARFTGNQLVELTPYGNAFSKLSLVSSGIHDEALYHIAQMPNIKALYLQKTNLDGSGIIHLKNMQNLEVLNLSYTKVDDKSVLDLLQIPNLREVYLFQTKASPDVIKALQEYKPTLRILMEEGPYL
jgi:uncharacterized membrane protein